MRYKLGKGGSTHINKYYIIITKASMTNRPVYDATSDPFTESEI